MCTFIIFRKKSSENLSDEEIPQLNSLISITYTWKKRHKTRSSLQCTLVTSRNERNLRNLPDVASSIKLISANLHKTYRSLANYRSGRSLSKKAVRTSFRWTRWTCIEWTTERELNGRSINVENRKKKKGKKKKQSRHGDRSTLIEKRATSKLIFAGAYRRNGPTVLFAGRPEIPVVFSSAVTFVKRRGKLFATEREHLSVSGCNVSTGRSWIDCTSVG